MRAKVADMKMFARVLALLVSASGASGCAAPYYWQAIGGQIELLRKREPIADIIGDPTADTKLKSTLTHVGAIRRFAVDVLELPDNDSYTTYVALDRPYVVWNVVAAPEFSVEPERWCFPFAGCVAYRGYFDREAAERFAAGLAARGLDTYSGGSSAYSTLGYFADPVLSTMVSGGEQYVASSLFHELAHQKFYVKDDSELSESFAMTVEEHGMERWLAENGTARDVEGYRERRARREQFGALVAAQQMRLRAIYASGIATEELRAQKRATFDTLRAEYSALKASWNGGPDYDAWFAQPLNNAVLASAATYTSWVPALRARLEAVGLTAFYADVAALAELSKEERTTRLREWAAAAVSASR